MSLIHTISNDTQLFGVIGDPILHSKSPTMHNRALAETGYNGIYMAFHIKPEDLPAFVQSIRVMGIGGVNVTIPHKQAVMELLDEIDPDALALGAVNTIVNHNGKLIGYNTDGIGYVRSLKEEAIADLSGKKIVVLGAGGASRGIIYSLLKEKPSSLQVVNRSVDKAEQLVSSLSTDVALTAHTLQELELLCADADVVINTTPRGMYPHEDEESISGAWLKPGAVASDLIYNPLKTKFLQTAEAKGCTVHGGLGMFIYQGAYAFEYWTNQQAPIAAMRQAVLAALQE